MSNGRREPPGAASGAQQEPGTQIPTGGHGHGLAVGEGGQIEIESGDIVDVLGAGSRRTADCPPRRIDTGDDGDVKNSCNVATAGSVAGPKISF